MRTFKRGLAAALLLLSPLVQAEGLEDQLNAFFAQKLAGFSDDVRVTVLPNLRFKLTPTSSTVPA